VIVGEQSLEQGLGQDIGLVRLIQEEPPNENLYSSPHPSIYSSSWLELNLLPFFKLSMDKTLTEYKYFNIYHPKPFVAHVEVNRPAQLNAFLRATWIELSTIFDKLSRDPDVRAIVLSGAGEKAFTAGLDVREAAEEGILADRKKIDPGRLANIIRRDVKDIQHCISCVERCEKRKCFLSLLPTFRRFETKKLKSGYMCASRLFLWTCN
jgi:hypothetical protein